MLLEARVAIDRPPLLGPEAAAGMRLRPKAQPLLDETNRGVERQVRHSVVGVAETRALATEGSCAFCVLEWLSCLIDGRKVSAGPVC